MSNYFCLNYNVRKILLNIIDKFYFNVVNLTACQRPAYPRYTLAIPSLRGEQGANIVSKRQQVTAENRQCAYQPLPVTQEAGGSNPLSHPIPSLRD
jgi:hypothetical protein